VKANGERRTPDAGRERYRIWTAHQRARAYTKRPKAAKLDDPVLCEKVTTWLEEFWPPTRSLVAWPESFQVIRPCR
jgi:hypothetical protein